MKIFLNDLKLNYKNFTMKTLQFLNFVLHLLDVQVEMLVGVEATELGVARAQHAVRVVGRDDLEEVNVRAAIGGDRHLEVNKLWKGIILKSQEKS